MSKYVLGIDNGGTVIKAALYDLTGHEVAVASSKVEMNIPEPGYTERDAEELWEANVRAIAGVVQQSGINTGDIAAIATTGHGNGLYLIGQDGTPVYPGIYSTDVRAQGYVDRWYADGTFDTVLPKTMQSIWAGQPVALLVWFQDHKPEILKKVRWIFMCKDYIRYRLTGEAYAEITDMSGSNLMNVRDVTYDRELLREFGLENCFEMLPPLKYSSEICGTVNQEAAQKTGLKVGTPVAGGLFDIDACAIATGITDDEKFCIIAGTWSINQYISKQPIVSKSLFMTSLYCVPGYWLATEASPTSASNLEWFVTEFLGDNYAPIAGSGKSVYDLCNEWVESIAPEETHIIFLPFLYGSNVEAGAKACFIGLKGWHHKAHILRALYEGVVFSHKMHIEKLLAYRDMPKVARITGGAARSEVWCQMFADVLQAPLEVMSGTELGTLGAAMCAGVATGHFPSLERASENMVQVVRTILPNPDNKTIYEEKYANYKKTVETLASLWKHV
ncbi:L-xylulose kinase LyxK [Candidatus Vecturithrix granuli]|uniref:L-xylulose kinase LyxK n=1 Tax=Vecturithrix granuli TaxID=1499967 RepID=A0A0S6W6E6_VECG1|nr:L-xylulose kinase LyxK [Candidatus Vecturithrix granuli]